MPAPKGKRGGVKGADKVEEVSEAVQAPEVDDEVADVPAAKKAKGRAKKVDEVKDAVDDLGEDESEEDNAAAKPKGRQPKKTASANKETEDAETEAPSKKAAEAKPKKAAKNAKADVDDKVTKKKGGKAKEENGSELPTRRGATRAAKVKPIVKEMDSDDEDDKPVPAKKGRGDTKAKAPAKEEPKKRGRAPKAKVDEKGDGSEDTPVEASEAVSVEACKS